MQENKMGYFYAQSVEELPTYQTVWLFICSMLHVTAFKYSLRNFTETILH